MWFVAAGVVLVLLKLLAFGSIFGAVSDWSWWWVLSPFACAVAWWAWADSSGLTQRKAMQRMDERKAARRARTLEALGQGGTSKRK
jgi:small Trp-rich protein